MANLDSLTINDTGYLGLASGTTSQRPASPSDGYMRYNTDLDLIEVFYSSDWVDIATGNIVSVVTDGLVLYLDAGNSSSYPGSGTTWTDLSSSGNDASLINGVSYSSASGGHLSFDGSNDYVSETSSLSDSFFQGNWTFSIWARFDVISTTTNGNSDEILLHHGSSSTRNGLHLVQRNSTIRLGLYADDLDAASTVTTNQWYNFVFTLNNSTYLKQIYINSSFENSNTGGGAYTGTGSNTRIAGQVLGFGTYLSGDIGIVMAYNKVLSSSEISTNFNYFKDRYGL